MVPGQVEYGGKCSVLERDDERVDAALQWPVMSPEAARAQEGANAAAARRGLAGRIAASLSEGPLHSDGGGSGGGGGGEAEGDPAARGVDVVQQQQLLG